MRVGNATGTFTKSPTPRGPPFVIWMPPPNVTGARAPGTCLDLYADGRAHALPSHARRERRLASWCGPRRDRDRSRAGSRTRGVRDCARGSWARAFRRARVGVVANLRRRDRRAVSPARLRPGLAALAVHDGRGSIGRGAPRLRPALSRRIDLSRNAADQLGSDGKNDRLRRGARARRARRHALARFAIRLQRKSRPQASRSRRRDRRRCLPTLRSPFIRMIRDMPAWSAAASGCCRCSNGPFRSSPTMPSILTSEPAPSK